MDVIGWVVVTSVLLVTITLVLLAPRLKRAQLDKQLAGTAGGGLAGVGSGFDAVWRPSAEDAHAEWEAQVEMPAPAPSPGDRGRIEDGRVVIQLDDPRDQR